MILDHSILYVRIFSVFLLAVSTYFVWVPAFSSLYKDSGQVVSVVQSPNGRVSADFQLNSGEMVRCQGKSTISPQCRADRLRELAATHETVAVWHKNGKPWQVQTISGEKVIDYQLSNQSANLILGVFWFVFGGMALFAPILIKKP